MNYLPLYILLASCALFTSCSNNIRPDTSIQFEEITSTEFITIDIYKNGRIKFNDAIISSSSFYSHINSLHIDSLTTIRVRIEDYAAVGVIHDVMTRIREASNERTRFSVFTSLEEEDRNNIELFLLKNGRIHFRGATLHIDDLPINFETLDIADSANVKVTIVDKAKMGTISDILNLAQSISSSKGEIEIYR